MLRVLLLAWLGLFLGRLNLSEEILLVFLLLRWCSKDLALQGALDIELLRALNRVNFLRLFNLRLLCALLNEDVADVDLLKERIRLG